MLDYGSHLFALALYFMGDVEEVLSWISHTTIQHGWKIDSPAMVMWKYKDAEKYGGFEVRAGGRMV